MMKLSLVVAVVALFCINICQSSFWDHKHGHSRVPLQRAGRDRPRPLRHHRHIQAHNGFHRPHQRNHRPMPPPPGHRRRSRPPPHFRHGPPFQNQGSMFFPNMNNNIPHNRPVDHSPPPRHEAQAAAAAQYFQQDEIIQEQSKHFPVTAVANHNQHQHQHQHQHVMQKMPPMGDQPHGYLSSTYKGWKPIVKPYQNSYLGGPTVGASNPKPSFAAITAHQPAAKPGHSLNPNLNLNTLFRENTNHMRTGNPKSAFSESHGMRVPSPPDVRESGNTEKPSHPSMPNFPWSSRFQMASQSEETASVIKRPFTKVKVQQKPQSSPPQSSPAPVETFDESPIKFPKFKFRPRPRPGGPSPFSKETDQEPPAEVTIQKAVSPPFASQSQPQSEEQPSPQDQQSLNLKAKLARGRVRVRTKTVKVEPSSQSEEDPVPPTKPSFENSSGPQSESQHHESKRQQQNSGPSFSPPRGNVPGHRHIVDSVDERNRGPPPPPPPPSHRTRTRGPHTSSSPPSSRGPPEVFNNQSPPHSHSRNPPNHQHLTERNPPPPPPPPPQNFYERPVSEPPFNSDFQENSGPPQNINNIHENNQREQHHQQRERRKRPKNGNQNSQKNSNAITETEQPQKTHQTPGFPGGPDFLDDIYFPPGFSPDPSKNTGRDPVSFMTMPGSKPQIIHHIYNSHHPQQEQQLYPNNVMRSPATDHDYRGPHEGHGSNPNGNNIPISRPQFATVNVHNRPIQSHGHNPNFHQHQQHNPRTIYPSNSNHESSYFPSAFSSNVAPYTYGGPSPYQTPPPPSRNHMSHSHLSPAAQHNIPLRLSPNQSSTMRNMYPPTDSSGPPAPFSSPPYEQSTMNSIEYRDSSEVNPYVSAMNNFQTSPSSYPPPPPPTSPRSVYYPPSQTTAPQRPLAQPPAPVYPEYVPSPSYGSAEYDKIPMQFMDQLKPILRDEQQSTQSTNRHTHQSPDIHPPATFFDDFFQPFDQQGGFNENPEQELDSKPSTPVRNQINGPAYGTRTPITSDVYTEAQSSPQAQVVAHPSSTSRYPSSTMAYKEISRTPSPTKAYPHSPPPSPSNRNSNRDRERDREYERESDMYPANPVASWSKLKENEVGVSSTESISGGPTPHQKKTNKVNQSKQHPSVSSSKSRVEVSKSKSKDVYKTSESKLPDSERVTTYKPSADTFDKNFEDDGVNGLEMRKTDQKSDSELTSPHEDDLSDSNTPKSVRVREKERVDKIATTTEVPEAFAHSTTFKSRRQFRRRRPDGSVQRRRFFSSRVKTGNEDEKYPDNNIINNNLKSQPEKVKESNPIEERDRDDDGYEPTRISALKHRRLFQRRRNLATHPLHRDRQHQEPESKEASTTPSHRSPPSSTEAEGVTYGESQWFRINPTESGELEHQRQHLTSSPSFHGGNKQLTLPESTTKMSGKMQQKQKLLSKSVPEIELLPLESTSEATSTESIPQPKFSSKHSVSFTEGRKFSIRKQSS